MPGCRAQPAPIGKEELLGSLPPEWPHDPLPAIRAALAASGRPTASSTTIRPHPDCSRCPGADRLGRGRPGRGAGRAARLRLPADQHPRPGRTTRQSPAPAGHPRPGPAARLAGRGLVVGIRGDSTLRGHHPAETWAVRDALAAEQGQPFDGELIVPSSPRAAASPSATSTTSWRATASCRPPRPSSPATAPSATSSSLHDGPRRRPAARCRAADVPAISIDDLRLGGPRGRRPARASAQGGRTVIANAVSYRDLEVLALGLLQAEQAGSGFVYRTAAGFVRARVGQAGRPLLTADEDRRFGGGVEGRDDVLVGESVGVVRIGHAVDARDGVADDRTHLRVDAADRRVRVPVLGPGVVQTEAQRIGGIRRHDIGNCRGVDLAQRREHVLFGCRPWDCQCKCLVEEAAGVDHHVLAGGAVAARERDHLRRPRRPCRRRVAERPARWTAGPAPGSSRRVIPVPSIRPGATLLTRTSGARATARQRVRWASAALDTA